MARYGKRKGTFRLDATDGELVQLGARMTPAQRLKANQVAEQLDISVSFLIAQLIDGLVIDPDGVAQVDWQRHVPEMPATLDSLTA